MKEMDQNMLGIDMQIMFAFGPCSHQETKNKYKNKGGLFV